MDNLSVDTFDLEDEFRSQWESEIKRLEDISKKIHSLHVKCLYCRAPAIAKPAKEAWITIVKNVSGSSGHWRELGVLLGLRREDLDYIEHSVSDDKTDTILRVYMQKENATMDKVTEALVKMKRFDILKLAEKPLLEMSCYFKENTTSSDAGYSSFNDSLIITPKNIPNSLPEVLKLDDDNQKYNEQDKHFPQNKFNLKSLIEIDKDKVILLLTFAEDGKAIADAIPGWVEEWCNDGLKVQIVTLNDRRHEVQLSPEVVIQELIEKADYIVPIVTEGYLQNVSCRDAVPNGTTNLDIQYARFIYSYLLHRFSLIDCCFNKNVRSILPKDVDSSITLKLRNHQILVPWTCEDDFNVTFKDLAKRALAKKHFIS